MNFDLDDSALDAALKTKQTSAPISESDSLSASSAAVDVKAGSRKLHSFEDEYTRSPPNSGRVLYDPRDQSQKQVRGSDNRSRRTSEKSDDVHSEGRGSAPKSQPHGRDGNRGPGPGHDPRDSLRGGYNKQQQSQLPPRFQKQLQQQQLQQNHHQQQLYHQQQVLRGDSRYDGRGQPDMERQRRDGPIPHHQSEWRGAAPPPQRMDPRPSQMNAHGPAATSAADEMNWRSASKKVTESTTSRSSDPRGPAAGISAEKEITILKHEKSSDLSVGSRPVTSSLTTSASAPSQQPAPAVGGHFPHEQSSVLKTSVPKPDSHPLRSVPVVHQAVNMGWASDASNTQVAALSNQWQTGAPGGDASDIRSQHASHDRSVRVTNLTTLGKKKSGGPSAPTDAPDPAAVKSRSDESSWRRKADEPPKMTDEQTKRSQPDIGTTDPYQNQRKDLRHSQESQPSTSSGGRVGSGDGSVSSDHSQNLLQRDRRVNDQTNSRDYNRPNLPAQNQPNLLQSKQRSQRHEERRHEIRPDNRNDVRGNQRRDDYQQYGQPAHPRDQRRDTRRRSQDDSMTFDYRDLPKNVLSGVSHESGETGSKDHSASQQFPVQRSDSHRKGQQYPNSRSSGPVLARVAGNSNYGPPPSKAAFESKSGSADSKAKPDLPNATSLQSRQSDSHAKREDERKPAVRHDGGGDHWKSERATAPRDEKQVANNQFRNHVRDEQRMNQRHSAQNYDARPQRDNRRSDHPNRNDRPDHRSDNRPDQRRDNRGNERQIRPDRRTTPPDSDVPPRFRKLRSGTESSKGSRSGQPDKSRSSASHPESDVGNEEWETASESSHKDLTVAVPPAAPVPSQTAVPPQSTSLAHKSQPDAHRNIRDVRKQESNVRSDQRQRQDRFDRDDRRDSGRRKSSRTDDRVKDDRRNSNRSDQRHEDGRGNRSYADDGGRRRRDDNRDHRQSENSRSNNRKWTEGQQSKANAEAIVQQMNQVKLDDPNAPESALSSLKKDMQSLSLNERREEKHSELSGDTALFTDRHKKRAKGSNEGTESKKMKPEV